VCACWRGQRKEHGMLTIPHFAVAVFCLTFKCSTRDALSRAPQRRRRKPSFLLPISSRRGDVKAVPCLIAVFASCSLLSASCCLPVYLSPIYCSSSCLYTILYLRVWRRLALLVMTKRRYYKYINSAGGLYQRRHGAYRCHLLSPHLAKTSILPSVAAGYGGLCAAPRFLSLAGKSGAAAALLCWLSLGKGGRR